MRISDYSDLIKHLPYEQQSFETSKETWKGFQHHEIFKRFCDKTFIDTNKTFSRKELIDIAKRDRSDGIFSIILWGYPSGYTRPNTINTLFPLFLENLPLLERRITFEGEIDFNSLKKFHKEIKGIGLSTLSKLFYFFNMTVEGHKAVIFDSRIIKVLEARKFDELVFEVKGKEKQYVMYLERMNELAYKHQYEVDQLELFLFMLGNNLKQIE